MKARFVLLIAISLIVFCTGSCSTNTIVSETIQTIDVFKDNKKNIQLGNDLLFVKYPKLIVKEIPALRLEDLKSISWDSVQSDNKVVSFRIKLDMKNRKIKQNREKLIIFFKASIKKQIDFQRANQEAFTNLITQTETVLGTIDEAKYEAFWAACSEEFLNKMPKEKILRYMQGKPAKLGKLIKRSLLCKLNFKTDKIKADIYWINFKSEYEMDIVQEYIAWTRDKESNTWKINGYGTRRCDQLCISL